jgi:MSHA pilin protein MshD
MMRAAQQLHERGVTLVETVIAIVVVAIAVSAVLGVLAGTSQHSSDALIMSQAVSIAEAYAEEISLKPFADPDGTDGEATRAAFDDADDYNGLVDNGAYDQFGNPIAGLGGYTVTVAAVPSGVLPGIGAADALRVDVRVRYAPYVDYVLSAYKTRF